MEKENKNKVSDEQQNAGKKKQEMLAIYNKIIAFADNMTDDYNDDPDIEASHVLMSFGVFMRRLECAMSEVDAQLKNGEPYERGNFRREGKSAFAEMTTIIKNGYELAKSLDTTRKEQKSSSKENEE